MSAVNDPIFEPFVMGKHQMPGVWRYLFPEEFAWLKLPDERHATCDDCYKVKFGEYRNDCRCCTYFPELSNFLVGLGLKSASRQVLTPLIERRLFLPMGLAPTPLRYQRIIAAYAADRFGEEPWMVCPFVNPETFHCGVYAFRNSVCSTFFCTNDHGALGNEFWGNVQDLAGQVESSIAQWCMGELGFSHELYVQRLDSLSVDVSSMSEPDTLAWDDHVYAALWGDWCGKELVFFENCAELVMKHRETLFEIARQQAGRDALIYEKNVRLFIPEKDRHEAPEIADENTERRPIDEAWYKLQLVERRLWQLPFQEGLVCLNQAVEVIDNPRDDLWSETSGEPFIVRTKDAATRPKVRELFGAEGVALLRLFETPATF
ncbi:MAG: hypothetical protein R3C68_11215 [Myxococcota bacterium]